MTVVNLPVESMGNQAVQYCLPESDDDTEHNEEAYVDVDGAWMVLYVLHACRQVWLLRRMAKQIPANVQVAH